MIPEPLHPAIVHFPIVFTVLLPLVAVFAWWWDRRRRARASGLWWLVVATAAALTLTSWLAVQTGEREEERVEHVVPERALEAHEEAGELFLGFTGATFLLALLGVVRGPVGGLARAGLIVAASVVLGLGYQVGHSGGELVYRHDAAAAYIGAHAYRAPAGD